MIRQRVEQVARAASYALVALALAAACGGGSSKDTGSSSGSATGTATVAPVGGATVIKIAFKDNAFDPKEFTVAVGANVEIEYENVGRAGHNMIIQSPNADGKNYQSPMLVNPKEQGQFEVIFTRAGQVQFFCAFHAPDMSGTITVR